MKKTLTVNLGGTVFHIDEDAYQLLDKYLSNLRIHFRREEGSDEIMNDFELRISELLNERIRLGYEVITIEHVEDVIRRMGKPEEIFGENYKEEKEEFKVKEEMVTAKRRLFRDPDDRILGGVAGGFAAYVGWDPTAVRLGLLLLTIFWGVIIPIYIILWMIIPVARTATEKLQMRGESVTVENIGKTVTDGFEKVSKDVNDYINSDKPRSTLQKIGDVLVTVVGAIIKVLGILLAIVLFPPVLLVLFILVVIFIALIAAFFGGGVGLLYHLMPFADWSMLGSYPESSLFVASISCILLVGIPVIALLYVVCSSLFKWKSMPDGAKWTLVILWIVSLVVTIYLATRYGLPVYNSTGWHWLDSSIFPVRHIRFW